MKTLKLIIAALLIFLLFFSGCIVNIIVDVAAPAAASADDPSAIKLVALALLADYGSDGIVVGMHLNRSISPGIIPSVLPVTLAIPNSYLK
jgi:hypothetical protein